MQWMHPLSCWPQTAVSYHSQGTQFANVAPINIWTDCARVHL